MKKLLLPLLLFLSLQSLAQYSVSGRVIDQASKQPVPNAVVFINNSSIANTTDSAGYFKLNVTTGQYHLLINIIGYENYKSPLTVKGNTVLNDIELVPKVNALAEVTVKARSRLSPCFPVFQVEFFGNNPFTLDCKILNPQVIQFYDINATGGFSARSSDFIEIENRALGYKIKFLLLYFIKDVEKRNCFFNGETFFEEMKGTPKQEKEWRKNRLECYQGSAMQLLRAVVSDSLAENGFRVKRASHHLNPYFNKFGLIANPYEADSGIISLGIATGGSLDDLDFSENTVFNDKLKGKFLSGKDLLLATNQKNIYAIRGQSVTDTAINSLYIEHIRNIVPVNNGQAVTVPWMWNGTVTIMSFKKPYIVFNNDGKILNVNAIGLDGFMFQQSRMATMLPFNYQPQQ